MAPRHGFEKDPGLTARMTVTMFMLFVLYGAFVTVLLLIHIPWPLVLAICLIALAVQYFASDRVALYSAQARIVTPQEDPELHGIVDRLCSMANMPKPRVAVVDTDWPNAFALGRSQKRAVVCVTNGIRRRLTPQELEAVIAHELSHVAHRDVAVMTIAGFLGILAGFLTRIFFWFGRAFRNAYGDILGLLFSAIVYVISLILLRALSRYRELAADRSAAILVGQPRLLAMALQKVSGPMARVPMRDMRAAHHLNAFFFSPAIFKGASVASLFSTHPPLQKRLDQLAKLEVEMGKTR